MTHKEMANFVETYISTYNKKDIDTMLGFYAENATMEDPVGAGLHSGEEAIRRLYQYGFDIDINLELEGAIRTAANYAIFPMCAKTESGKLQIIDLFEFDTDGKISSMKAYWSEENLEGNMELIV